MNGNEAIAKINKMGKVGAIIILIVKILLGIGIVGCAVGMIATAVLPANLVSFNMKGNANVMVDLSNFGKNIFEDAQTQESVKRDVKQNTNISYGNAQFDVNDVSVEGSKMNIQAQGELTKFNLRDCTWGLLGAEIMLIFSFITAVFAGRLAKAIRDCATPFEDNVITKIKQFAFSLIPWCIITSVVGAIEQAIWFSGSKIDIDLNIGMVCVVLVVLALSYIFQYGALLQKEYDETL